MKCVKWLILLVFFAFAESAPFYGKHSEEENISNITKVFKYTIQKFILHTRPELTPQNNKTYEEKLGEDTFKLTTVNKGSYGELLPIENGFKVKVQVMVFMEVFLQRYGHSFVTEIFPADGTISYIDEQKLITDDRITWTSDTSIKVESFDVDHFEINLKPDDYQYKPNEKEEIKQEIRKLVKNIAKKNLEAKIQQLRGALALAFVSLEISQYLNDYFLNTKERYYTIGDIRTNNYTLNNVAINGLWNVQSFTLNASNLEAAPQVEFGAVNAIITQNFETNGKEPLELNFNASNVYIYANQNYQKDVNRKLRVKITGYSFKNTKTNTVLEEDESKSIVAEIESAFVASLLSKSH